MSQKDPVVGGHVVPDQVSLIRQNFAEFVVEGLEAPDVDQAGSHQSFNLTAYGSSRLNSSWRRPTLPVQRVDGDGVTALECCDLRGLLQDVA